MLNKREITATTWTKNKKEFFGESLYYVDVHFDPDQLIFVANNFRSIINKVTYFHLCSILLISVVILKKKYLIIKGLSFRL